MNQQSVRRVVVKSLFGEHKVSGKEETKLHMHGNFEIYYVVSGGSKFYIDNKIYEISPRDLFIIPPESVHLCLNDSVKQHDRYVLYAHPKFLAPVPEDGIDIVHIFDEICSHKTHQFHLNEKQHKSLIALLQKFLSCSGYGKGMLQYITTIEILLFVCALFENNKDSKKIEQIEESQINIIIKYIKKNLAGDLTLESIAKSLEMSKRSLSTTFKKTVNKTICNYIIKCRIIEAKKLLSENVPVTQVSEMVGFKTYTHFGRTFNLIVGQSPKKYQLALQKQYCNNDQHMIKYK